MALIWTFTDHEYEVCMHPARRKDDVAVTEDLIILLFFTVSARQHELEDYKI